MPLKTTKQPTKIVERDAAGLDRERLAALYKEHHLDVKYEKESANEVNFEKLF